ncbi:MAG: hypothetical protein V4722_17905 [Bacteroidota bacterium]
MIELFAGDGDIDALKKLLEPDHTQLEIDIALENAIAYSQIKNTEYLLSLGADISSHGWKGAYYAAHNNELEGLKFAIEKGVAINVDNGLLLNTGIVTAINTKDIELVKWLFDNGSNPRLLTTQSLKTVADVGTNELKTLIKNAT